MCYFIYPSLGNQVLLFQSFFLDIPGHLRVAALLKEWFSSVQFKLRNTIIRRWGCHIVLSECNPRHVKTLHHCTWTNSFDRTQQIDWWEQLVSAGQSNIRTDEASHGSFFSIIVTYGFCKPCHFQQDQVCANHQCSCLRGRTRCISAARNALANTKHDDDRYLVAIPANALYVGDNKVWKWAIASFEGCVCYGRSAFVRTDRPPHVPENCGPGV